jgi:hypothetical protein
MKRSKFSEEHVSLARTPRPRTRNDELSSTSTRTWILRMLKPSRERVGKESDHGAGDEIG